MMTLLLVSLAVYVIAALKHIRIRHNDASLLRRLLHVGRLLAFAALGFVVYDLDPAATPLYAAYLWATMIDWYIDDRDAVLSGRAADTGMTRVAARMHRRA